MNILYCGNDRVEEGLILSILSLMKNNSGKLNIYVLTMRFETQEKTYQPISKGLTNYLDTLVKSINPANTVSHIDITELFSAELPTANLATRFTPYCMLRLFAEKVPGLPEKILYLDTDVLCRRDCGDFYHQDFSEYEIAGVLDYYGRWFFRSNMFRADYLNSGVLLMNLEMIRKTKLLQKCRRLCAEKEMFLPDQSALNKMAVSKKIVPRRYNDQRKLHKDTVFQHFSTTFRFFPWIRTVTVKPWEIEKVHTKLKIHEYDDIFAEFAALQQKIKSGRL